MRTNLFIKSTFLMLSVATILFTASCSGSEGPEGPKGEQGAQGIPGKDGAVIHSGTGAPAASLGNIGDMYLDKSSSNLYGPKSASGWGTPLNLKGAPGATGTAGATGPAGTAGSRILSGTTNPSASTGTVGDYYLNKTTGDFFGPKTTSGWGTPVNLKGTANVVASTWINYNWNSTNTSTRKVMDYTIPTPLLSAVGYSSLYNFSNAGGVILVYGENWGSNQVKLFDYEFLNGRYEASPNTNGSKIYIKLTSISGAALQDIEYDSARGNKFRYVLIPAGVQLSASLAPDRLRQMSFEDIQARFNLYD
ncbi:MAG: hypothetical protein VB075_07160 [Petrimonas sp.]|uniref:hypothetical protein n=1 Tax=Petrimonas sp. TaxID=2023866 RepID=UPI002B388461|nr:hypothetical protein [Petrimonas sp.]MEA5044338.1 hypothetical protein [Petrimonas sp.]